ncbi:hypothetical protein [Nostoc sp. UHCC 0870]|uniref:hypothetical protein n=1 Tax=Nostoc sp. UHCC 0870 TaxID=2914041 RepID=UPI001EDF23C4|nr:hypothetical protein [Nostoc sp. UHCC 0870]UKO99377.1 hypothetical protein L6494_06590 [Nostoc sp. UHCC 0870]
MDTGKAARLGTAGLLGLAGICTMNPVLMLSGMLVVELDNAVENTNNLKGILELEKLAKELLAKELEGIDLDWKTKIREMDKE